MNQHNSQIQKSRAARLGLLLLAALLLATQGCLVALSPLAPPLSGAQRSFDPAYGDWNYLLAHYVKPGGVDYAGMKKDQGRLEIALTKLTEVTPEQFAGWSREAQLAFLINAHNANAVLRIVRHYPVRSLGATGGFIPLARNERNLRLLGRSDGSLKSLVGEIMHGPYQESRAIFLLNWATRGNAPLPPVAITGANIKEMLERQTRAFMADPRYHEFNLKKNIIYVSPLLKWYRPELERDYAELWGFLQKYLPAEEAKRLKAHPPRIRFLWFDRHLNDAATPGA